MHLETSPATGFDAALSAAISLSTGSGAPEWVHLLPAGEIKTRDGRGPYHVADMTALALRSLPEGEKLVIDENHATDLAAPEGRSAPARGWIVALEARSDGLWGRVEWTAEGRRIVESREYRGISPNFLHDRNGNLIAVQRASLVNQPNLRGLAALHQEEKTMDFMAKLRKALGLADDAGEDAILAAVKKTDDAMQAAEKAKADAETALQAETKAKTDAETALQAAKAAKADGEDETTITALQSELKDVTDKLNAVTSDRANEKATAFVDAAIAAKRVGIKPLRDKYIAMHAKDPAATEELINAMPVLGNSGAAITPPETKDGKVSLNSEQSQAAKLLGISADDYRKTLEAERQTEEAL